MHFEDDKPKNAENTDFEAGSDNTPMANRKDVFFMKQTITQVLSSEKVLMVLVAGMYILGCLIETII